MRKYAVAVFSHSEGENVIHFIGARNEIEALCRILAVSTERFETLEDVISYANNGDLGCNVREIPSLWGDKQ